MQRAAVRFLASAGGAIALTLLVYAALPTGLDIRTDVVGYPTFANFDIDRYFWKYGLIVVVFPLAVIGAHALLTRLFVGRMPPWRPLPAPLRWPEDGAEAGCRRAWAVAVGRALFVGAVAGLELAVLLTRGWAILVVTAVVYAACVALVGWIGSRAGRRDGAALVSTLNTVATPFLVAGLWGASRSTEVEVAASGAVHRYPWLPAWIGLGVAATLLVVLVVGLRRRDGRAAAQSLERIAVLLVAAPVALFLLVAELPGDLGTFDSYEEGQALAGAELVRDGAFPWRDLMLTHGVLSDVFRGVLGFALFDESRWGLVAGDEVLLLPLAWVALYYLCAYLFWTNGVFLVGTQLLVVTGVVTSIQIRLILVPCVLLVLAALLLKPSVLRAVAFTSLVFVQVVITPEALVLAVAALVTLAAFEFSYRDTSDPFLARYRRIALGIAAALGLAAAWSILLAALGALDDWAFGLVSVIPEHRYTGGIESLVPTTEFEVFAPVLAVLVVYAFVAVRVRLRRPFAYQDWLMIAMGLFTLLYYAKFLSRADRYHLDQSFAAAVPLLFYLAFRGITYVEARLVDLARGRGLFWFPRRHTLTVPVLVALLAAASTEPLSDVLVHAPRHFSAQVAQEPTVAGIGYARPGENDVEALESLGSALDDLVESGETVFDFSNAPGVLHYLLGSSPSTRYYHVSFAIRGRTQADLVGRLESRPAGAVVIPTSRMFNNLSAWDGIANQVRHHDVSEHLLGAYVPVRAVEGAILMVPRAVAGAVDPGLYFGTDPCDWGYAPNFLVDEPREGAPSVRLPLERSADAKRFVVNLPSDAAEFRWLEVRAGAALADGRFEVTDRLGGETKRTIAFSAVGLGERVLHVKVGSCSQWHGYRPGRLYLTTSVPQDLDEVRLLR